MARAPSYPEDAAVGDPAAAPPPPPGKKDDGKSGAGSARTKRIVTGAAIGIGSAALVAALLYANRSRKTDKS